MATFEELMSQHEAERNSGYVSPLQRKLQEQKEANIQQAQAEEQEQEQYVSPLERKAEERTATKVQSGRVLQEASMEYPMFAEQYTLEQAEARRQGVSGKQALHGLARGVAWLFRPLGALQSAAVAPIAKNDYESDTFLGRTAEAFQESGKVFWQEIGGHGGTPRKNYERGVMEYALGPENVENMPPLLRNTAEVFLGVFSDPAIVAVPFRKTIQEGLAAAAREGRAPRVFQDTVAEMYSFVEASPQQAKVVNDLAKKADKGDKAAAKKLAEKIDENVKKQIKKATGESTPPKGAAKTPRKEGAKAKPKTDKEKLAKKAAVAHEEKKLEAKKKKPKTDLEDIDAQLAKIEKDKKKQAKKDKPVKDHLDKLAGKKAKVDAVLHKEGDGVDGIQLTLNDESKTTFTLEGDPLDITKKEIDNAIKAKEDEFAKAKAVTKKGGSTNLEDGVVGGGKPLAVKKDKPVPWSKVKKVAVMDENGNIKVSEKDFNFSSSNRGKDIDEAASELRKLASKTQGKKVKGFINEDGSEFIPLDVQRKKAPLLAEAEAKTAAKQQKTYMSETKRVQAKEAAEATKREKILKQSAQPKAQHRLVQKKNKHQASSAASKWIKANPDLAKHFDRNDLIQQAEAHMWEQIRLTPLKRLKAALESKKEASKLGGELNKAVNWHLQNWTKEELGRRAGGKTRDRVTKELKAGTFKLPTQHKEAITPGSTADLAAGIQDPELKDLARWGLTPEDLREGEEAIAKVTGDTRPARDERLAREKKVSLPKPGKAAAFGQKEMSPRSRKSKLKRLKKRELEMIRKGKAKKKTAKEHLAEQKQRLDEAKAKEREAQHKLREAIEARKGGEVSEGGKVQAYKWKSEQLKMDMEKAKKKAADQAWNVVKRQKEMDKAKANLKEGEKLPVAGVGEEISGAVEAHKLIAKNSDDAALAAKLRELETKGGHYLSLETLADIRRLAAKMGKDKLAKQAEVLMMKEQQRLATRSNAKSLKKGSGGTELYSGIPLHKMQTLLLDPIANTWIKMVDKGGAKLSKYMTGKILGNDHLTWAWSSIVEDFGLTKAYKLMRRDFKQQAHQWKMFSSDLGQATRKIDGDFTSATRKLNVSKAAAQLRARQIAGGSITAFDDKFKSVKEASQRFESLEKMLTDRGLLKDHQFKRLTNNEIKKTHRYLDNIPSKKYPNPGIKQKQEAALAKISNLKKTDPRYQRKLNELTNELKALENERIEKITRLQIHYKNSGHNYFRILYNKMNKDAEFGRFIGLREGMGRLGKKWAIRRENWQVDLGDQGEVIVSRRGKPMKSQQDLGKMIHKGISEEARDAFLYDLFNRINRSSRWVRKSPAKGFMKLKGSAEDWGPLAGKYVAIPVHRELIGQYKDVTKFEKVLHKTMGLWKAGKVVWSPRAQARNFLSNIILGDILGDVSVWEAIPKHVKNITDLTALKYGNFETYASKARMSKVDQDITKAFKYESTLMDTSFTKAEIEEAMRLLDFTKLSKATDGGIHTILEWFNKTKDFPSRSYQMLEEGMKLTIFRKEIKNWMIDNNVKDLDSLTKVQRRRLFTKAEGVANYALFDYGKVPPAIRWARNGYSPFITFTYKAVPRLAKTFVRKPWKAAKWLGGLWAIQKWMDVASGDSPEDIEYERRNLPDYMQRNTLWGLPGQHSHIRLPWKNKDGMSQYLDVSFVLPWGDVSEGFGSGNLLSRSIMPNHPFWNFVGDVRANENIFLDQPLTWHQDQWHEVGIKYMKHAWDQIEPGLLDSTFKTADKLWNRPADWRGRDNDLTNVVLDAWFGLKIRNVEVMEQAMFKHKSEIGEPLRDIHKEAYKRYNDLTFKKKLQDSDPEKYEQEIEKLWRDLSEDVQRIQDKAYYLMNEDDDK